MLFLIISIILIIHGKSETLFHMLNRPAKMRLSISRDYIRSFTWADFTEMQACRYI